MGQFTSRCSFSLDLQARSCRGLVAHRGSLGLWRLFLDLFTRGGRLRVALMGMGQRLVCRVPLGLHLACRSGPTQIKRSAVSLRRNMAILTPFLVVRASWHVIDDCDARLTSQNEAWIGWMASPPPDWGAVRGRWAALTNTSSLDEANFIFGARPSGTGAPLLETEQFETTSQRRVALLDAAHVMTASVPRVWSQEWIDSGNAQHLWPREVLIESALRECGFGAVMPLGRILTCSGPDYWANVAWRESARWEALNQALQLEDAVPAAPARGARSL